ncbi:hypothetical protein T265_15470, partial [Opisthorchis viverrini]
DFQILYGAYVRPLLECANQVVYSGRTKDVTLIERVQRAATKMVAGLKSVDYETRLAMLDLFPLKYRRLRGDLLLTYALSEQGLASRTSPLTQHSQLGQTSSRCISMNCPKVRKSWFCGSPTTTQLHSSGVSQTLSPSLNCQLLVTTTDENREPICVTASDVLTLTAFYPRAVVDFGTENFTNRPFVRYLLLENPHDEDQYVSIRRGLPPDEFMLTWIESEHTLTTQSDLTWKTPGYELLTSSSSAPDSICVRGSHGRCLLRITWNPSQPKSSDNGGGGFYHIIQFRVNDAFSLQALVVGRLLAPVVERKTRLKRPQRLQPTVFSMPLGITALQRTRSYDRFHTSQAALPTALLIEQCQRGGLERSFSAQYIDEESASFGRPKHSLKETYPGRVQNTTVQTAIVGDVVPERVSRVSSGQFQSALRRQSVSLPRLPGPQCTFLDDASKRPASSLHRTRPAALNLIPAHATDVGFVSPKLIRSPALKRDPQLTHSGIYYSGQPGGNLFYPNAPGLLSELSERGLTQWLNSVFAPCIAANSNATRAEIPCALGGRSYWVSLNNAVDMLHTPIMTGPGQRVEREVDEGKIVPTYDLSFRVDKGAQRRLMSQLTDNYAPIWLHLALDALNGAPVPKSAHVSAVDGVLKLSDPTRLAPPPVPLSQKLRIYLFTGSSVSKCIPTSVPAQSKKPTADPIPQKPGTEIDPRDIVNGHREKSLALLWCLLLRYQVLSLVDMRLLDEEIERLRSIPTGDKAPDSSDGEETGTHSDDVVHMKLFLWASLVCRLYQVEVLNLDESFSDGRALCVLLHHYLPTVLPGGLVRHLTTSTASSYHLARRTPHLARTNRYNLQLFQRKLSYLGDVPALLEPSMIPDFGDQPGLLPPALVLATLAYLVSRLISIGRQKLRDLVEDHAARILQTAWRKRQQVLQARNLRLLSCHKRATSPRYAILLFYFLFVFSLLLTYQREKCAAVVIQSCWRGFLARRQLFVERRAAVRIQTWWRGKIAKQNWVALRRWVIDVQRMGRTHLARERYSIMLVDAERRNKAAIRIQSFWRTCLFRRQLAAERCSAVRIQALWRGILARRKYVSTYQWFVDVQRICRAHLARQRLVNLMSNVEREKCAAVVIQSCWRGFLARRQLFVERRAAVRIQTWWRGKIAKQNWVALRRWVIDVQRMGRTHLARERYSIMLVDAERRSKAAIRIQSFWRTCLFRRQLAAERCSAVRIQALWRGILARRKYVSTYQLLINVQCVCRAHLARKRFSDRVVEAERRNRAAILIQSHWRRLLARQQFAKQRSAAIYIQSWWRAQLAKQKWLSIRLWVIDLQRTGRRYLVRTQVSRLVFEAEQANRAAVRIQSCWRGFLERRRLSKKRSAAVRIQAWWRGQLVRRKWRETCQAVVIVQAYIRGFLARRRVAQLRRTAVQLRAATVIQAFWRGLVVRRRLSNERLAASRIQHWWRGRIAHQRFVRTYQAQKSALIRGKIGTTAIQRTNKLKTKCSKITFEFHLDSSEAHRLIRIRTQLFAATKVAVNSPNRRLCARARAAADCLIHSRSVTQVLQAIKELEIFTRLSSEICFWSVGVLSARSNSSAKSQVPSHPADRSPLLHLLFLDVIQACNRSVPHEDILLRVTGTLLNIARHRRLAEHASLWWTPPSSQVDHETWISPALIARTRSRLSLSLSPTRKLSSTTNTENQCLHSPPRPHRDHSDDRSATAYSSVPLDGQTSVVEALIGILLRTWRARPGTLVIKPSPLMNDIFHRTSLFQGIRLFARTACLLAMLCDAIPMNLLPTASLLPVIRELSNCLARRGGGPQPRRSDTVEHTMSLLEQTAERMRHTMSNLRKQL